jgi:excinuclease ABC subunit A
LNEIIKIRGATVNNLKSVDLDISVGKIICFTGPSGSGKSSLAFHTLYAESKRRFLNSLPSFLKFFNERPAPVSVESISPVLPVFALPQTNPVMGSRSNVGDLLGITEKLGKLFFQLGRPTCPDHRKFLKSTSLEREIGKLITKKDHDEKSIMHLFVEKSVYEKIFTSGPMPSRSIAEGEDGPVAFNENHRYWEILRFRVNNLDRVEKKLEEIIPGGQKKPLFYFSDRLGFKRLKWADYLVCSECDYSFTQKISAENFSPFNALGACGKCGGYGSTLEYDEKKLVSKRHLSVKEGGITILNYKRFARYLTKLEGVLEKENISLTSPIDELEKPFWEILFKGKGGYPGVDSLLKKLEAKKYKSNVRIYIRGKQSEYECPSCEGVRVSKVLFNYQLLNSKTCPTLFDIYNYDIGELGDFFENLETTGFESFIAHQVSEIKDCLSMSKRLGLGHLKYTRKAKSISSGEYQRLLLVKYFCFQGSGSLFVFDEPSLGLGYKEQKELYLGFKKLKKQGNTVILVDHSEFIQAHCDEMIKIGPGSGQFGGEITYQGKPEKFKNQVYPRVKSILETKDVIKASNLSIFGSSLTELAFPIGKVSWVTGDSGTGKSAFVLKTLANAIHRNIYDEDFFDDIGTADNFEGLDKIKDIVIIAANTVKMSSRSTVGSYTGISPVVRKYFSALTTSRSMGAKDGHFSSNSELGKCPECEGKGKKTIELQFVEDLEIECENCGGRKLNPIYGGISDGEFTAYEALGNPLSEILERVKLTPKFQRIWDYLKILNLDYLSLDREVKSLSGGEFQRLMLLNRLQKNMVNSLLVFENISFGLGSGEIANLCNLISDLQKMGNTVVIVDQSPQFASIAEFSLNFNGLAHSIR